MKKIIAILLLSISVGSFYIQALIASEKEEQTEETKWIIPDIAHKYAQIKYMLNQVLKNKEVYTKQELLQYLAPLANEMRALLKEIEVKLKQEPLTAQTRDIFKRIIENINRDTRAIVTLLHEKQ